MTTPTMTNPHHHSQDADISFPHKLQHLFVDLKKRLFSSSLMKNLSAQSDEELKRKIANGYKKKKILADKERQSSKFYLLIYPY